MNNCNYADLTPYEPSPSNPWDLKQVQYLYRRLGSGASKSTLNKALDMTPSALVDKLIEETKSYTLMPDPGWGFLNREQIIETYDQTLAQDGLREIEYYFFDELRTKHLRGSLMLFWRNHFVTRYDKAPPYLYQNYILHQKYCIGNLKEFVYEVGIDPQMLEYLNGDVNTKTKPNENFARELFELFTLAVDNNYTEKDITETARALTGYNSTEGSWGAFLFNEKNSFDDGEKEIFGQVGNWNYSDVVDILFEFRASEIAHLICSKLYKFYISPNVNEDIVTQLANIYVNNNFEIEPVLSVLFKSEHFFDTSVKANIIKWPIDFIIGLQNELELQQTPDYPRNLNSHANTFIAYLEARIFHPPNVAGYPADENWLNSVTVLERFKRIYHVLKNQLDDAPEVYVNFVKNLFELNTNANDVAKGIVDFLLPVALVHEQEYNNAISAFKSNVPINYFNDGTWDLNYEYIPTQVFNLLIHITQMPEFHLK